MGGRGRQHNRLERELILNLIAEAVAKGARFKEAAKVIELSARTLIRWKNKGGGQDLRNNRIEPPANKLNEFERQRILDVSTSRAFHNLSPKQIVPLLADQGEYIGSESSFYRVLRAHNMKPSRPAEKARPKEHVATGPCQVGMCQ